MSKFFEYTDELGIKREAEAFITADYTSTPQPNKPIITTVDGYLDPSLMNPTQDYGIKSKTDYITLTPTQILNKKVILSEIPVSNPTLTPDGGIPQRFGIDFSYQQSDNSVTWASLGLEGFLEEGETLEVSYFYK